MAGKLFGIGIGPGDPELITLKAFRIMKESEYIVAPGKSIQSSVALSIVKQAIPEIMEKEIILADFPMTKDRDILRESHERISDDIEKVIKQDKNVAFITLGDPTVYSTFIYIHNIILQRGYESLIIPGVPSFCAVAASLNEALSEMDEQIHIIPASYDLKGICDYPGTKILMKSGKNISNVKDSLSSKNISCKFVENCGMVNEKKYNSIDELPTDAGYFTLGIIKDLK